jgi:hypothetical protein
MTDELENLENRLMVNNLGYRPGAKQGSLDNDIKKSGN